MSKHKMRSNWVAGDGDPQTMGLRRSGSHRATGGSRRRRPWMVATAGAAALGTVAAVAITLGGVGATPALAVCDSSGGTCVDATAATGSQVAILPLSKASRSTLTVSNDGVDGDTEVGVVGYLTGSDPSSSAVTTADASTSASVRVDRGQRRHVRLSGVPATASAVMVQVGSSWSRSSWAKSRAACAAPTGDGPAATTDDDATSAAPTTDATTDGATEAATADTTSADTRSAVASDEAPSCGSARVAFSGRHDKVTRSQIVRALRDWASTTSTSMPTTTAVSDLTQSVSDASGSTANLAAAIAPGPGALTVSWRLDAGDQDVSAVRVSRSGENGASTGGATVERPARSGTYTLKGLTAGSMYAVTVAPVVGGKATAPIMMSASALAGAAASSTEPSASPSASASSTPKATREATASASPSAPASASASASASAGSSGGTGSSGTGLPGANAYSGWTQVIAQNFDTAAPVGSFASKYNGWAGYDGNTSGASGTTWNSGTTMSVSDSVLRMRNWVSGGKAQAGALTPVTSGTPWYSMSQTYGKYVVRFKSDSVKGFKVAWLLWPTSNNWSQGELDFPEANLDGTINWSAHNVRGNPEDQTWGSTGTRMADGAWHTATTTWEPGKVTYELDGKVVKTVTDGTFLPTAPMRWALQNEMSTDGTKPAGNADGSVYIDWVAQYKRG